MAITTYFMDSFETTTTATDRYETSSGSGSFSISSSVKRTGTQALQAAGVGSENYLGKTLSASPRTLIVGAAYRPTGNGNVSQLYKGPFVLTSGGTIQCYLKLNASSQLELWHRDGVNPHVKIATTAGSITHNIWTYLELRLYAGSTDGEYEIRINGATAASGAGVRTRDNVNYYDTLRLQTNIATHYLDDLYVRGDTVLQSGGFFGDVEIQCKFPDADGTYTDLTPSSGSNWQNVDERPPDADTTYNASGTTGHKDSYSFDDISLSSQTIRSLQLSMRAKKTDSGSQSIAPFVKSGGTEQTGTTQALSTSYGYHVGNYDTDPDTSLAWSESGVNAAEFGPEVGG